MPSFVITFFLWGKSSCNIIADIWWRYGNNCPVCNMTLWLSNSFCQLYWKSKQNRRERYIIEYNSWMSDRWRWIMINHITTYIGMCSRLMRSPFIINAMASQITSLTNVNPTVYSVADQRTHQSSASLAFVRGIHRWPVYHWILNIGLNMFPLDSFMSCLQSLLGYSTGEFQALQLIVLVAFGAVD